MLNEYFNSVILHRKDGWDVKTKHYLLGTGNAHILLISSNKTETKFISHEFLHIFKRTHKSDATSFLDSELDQLHGCAKLNFNTNESCCTHFPQQDSTIPHFATAVVCLPPKKATSITCRKLVNMQAFCVIVSLWTRENNTCVQKSCGTKQ